jgi:stearoyl-CoA desaturase (delta-9 desaturase)
MFLPEIHPLVALALGLLVTQLAVFATTVYLHRGLAHRAVTVRPAAALPFRFVVWIATGMRPREWAAVHRKHHAHTDEPADPHSPKQLGFWRVQLANAALYRKVARDEVAVKRYARDLRADGLDRALFDHAFLGLGVGITTLVVVTTVTGLGWATGLLAAVIHAVTYLGLSGVINAVGHTFGKQPHPNSATNLQSVAWVTAGEGLHNNHHAAPTSATFALQREVDPGWWLVRALVALRLAEVRHGPGRLRAEVALPRREPAPADEHVA